MAHGKILTCTHWFYRFNNVLILLFEFNIALPVCEHFEYAFAYKNSSL